MIWILNILVLLFIFCVRSLRLWTTQHVSSFFHFLNTKLDIVFMYQISWSMLFLRKTPPFSINDSCVAWLLHFSPLGFGGGNIISVISHMPRCYSFEWNRMKKKRNRIEYRFSLRFSDWIKYIACKRRQSWCAPLTRHNDKKTTRVEFFGSLAAPMTMLMLLVFLSRWLLTKVALKLRNETKRKKK